MWFYLREERTYLICETPMILLSFPKPEMSLVSGDNCLLDFLFIW